MPPRPKPKGEYIETDTGNKVSRRAKLHGTQHIVLGGRTVIQAEVTIRGDLVREAPTVEAKPPAKDAPVKAKPPILTSIAIGRYTIINTGATLKPPARNMAGKESYVPLKIGDHTFIGPRVMVEAASIGDHVHVGEDAVIGPLCIIKDYVKVLPGAILPPSMVVPSGMVVGGQPARIIGEVGDGWGVLEQSEGGDLREFWRQTGSR